MFDDTGVKSIALVRDFLLHILDFTANHLIQRLNVTVPSLSVIKFPTLS